MNVSELVPTYRARLEALPADAAPAEWWTVLAELAAEPVSGIDPERDADQLLFEATSVSQTVAKAPGYAVDITREVLPEDGDPVYVTCSFAYAPVRGAANVQIWGAPGADGAAAWIDEVRASPAFALLDGPALAAVIDAMGVRG
jgi:hypothetical protein